jgi:hypothetical protein
MGGRRGSVYVREECGVGCTGRFEVHSQHFYAQFWRRKYEEETELSLQRQSRFFQCGTAAPATLPNETVTFPLPPILPLAPLHTSPVDILVQAIYPGGPLQLTFRVWSKVRGVLCPFSPITGCIERCRLDAGSSPDARIQWHCNASSEIPKARPCILLLACLSAEAKTPPITSNAAIPASPAATTHHL